MVRVKFPASAGETEQSEAAASEQPEPRRIDIAAALEGSLKQTDLLRQGLIAKHAEIEQLRQAYRYGVEELEEELMFFIRRAGSEALPSLRMDPRTELLLLSIQRRQAYAERLEKPLAWLEEACEELLYLKRRATGDLLVADLAPGVDFSAHAQRITEAIDRFQPTVERLAISAEEAAPPQPLESIWKRLIEKHKGIAATAQDGLNRGIVEEVCVGELRQLAELSLLSLKGARCLAESKTAELFLTRVTDLSPAAALKLGEWQGKWLCLNGLKNLTPEVARQLFRWPGLRISLNGLNELAAETAAAIPSWRGRQIELMGLKKVAGVEHLAAWENSGGKLFVPADIRKQIDRRRSSPGQPAADHSKNR